jgi:GWxTD domain-containing protein
MSHVTRLFRFLLVASLAGLGPSACSRASGGGAPAPRGVPAAARGEEFAPIDVVPLYDQMGLLATGGPMPFVASVAFLASASSDSTWALVTVSFANRALTFAREGDRYVATYDATFEARREDAVLARVTSREQVRVGSFKETSRTDESVLLQQLLVLPPGAAELAVTIRDDGSGRVATARRALAVPRLAGTPTLGTPVPFYQAVLRSSLDSLPRIVPTPRSTVVFGRDSTVPVYLEAYGPGDQVTVRARVETEGATLFVDSLPLLRRGPGLFAGVFDIPVRRLGIGVTTISFRRPESGDSVAVPVFVTFGDALPVATFDQMLSYLRYFASATRLRALREVPVEQRAEAWQRFVEETDPVPQTTDHEGLREYFQRVQVANQRFRDEGTPGWLTDRGMVYIVLGEPEQVRELNPMDLGQRGRLLIWDYPSRRLSLLFRDATGFGRWRLDPGSQADFQAIARSIQDRRG